MKKGRIIYLFLVLIGSLGFLTSTAQAAPDCRPGGVHEHAPVCNPSGSGGNACNAVGIATGKTSGVSFDKDANTVCYCDANVDVVGASYCEFGTRNTGADFDACARCEAKNTCGSHSLGDTWNEKQGDTWKQCQCQEVAFADTTIQRKSCMSYAAPSNQCSPGTAAGNYFEEGANRCMCKTTAAYEPCNGTYNKKTCERITKCSLDLKYYGKRLEDLNSSIASVSRAGDRVRGVGSGADDLMLPDSQIADRCKIAGPKAGKPAKFTAVRVVPFIVTGASSMHLSGRASRYIASSPGATGDGVQLQCTVSIANKTNTEQSFRFAGRHMIRKNSAKHPRIIRFHDNDCTTDRNMPLHENEDVLWKSSYNAATKLSVPAAGSGLRDQLKSKYKTLDDMYANRTDTLISTNWSIQSTALKSGSVAGPGGGDTKELESSGVSEWYRIPAGGAVLVTFKNDLPELVGDYPGQGVSLDHVCSGWIQACDDKDAKDAGSLIGSVSVEWLTNEEYGTEQPPMVQTSTRSLLGGSPF